MSEGETQRVRLVAWNLRHGGGNTRTPEQAMFLRSLTPDVVVLSEAREARGSQLRAILADDGLVHALEPSAPPPRNRVSIVSRFALKAVAEDTWHPRFAIAEVPQLGITLCAVHVPDESNEQSRSEIWRRVVDHARILREKRVLIAGDFNTQRTYGSPGVPGLAQRVAWRGGKRVGQSCERMMGMLATFGYKDVMCVSNGRGDGNMQQQPTWFGPGGEKYALDGIWASSQLIEQCRVCMASAFRDERCVSQALSDHAAIGVDLKLPRGIKNSRQQSDEQCGKPEIGGLFGSQRVDT